MQPADIARIVSVSSPALSPDGRRVAFVVGRIDLEAIRRRSAVWLADVDGTTAPNPLTAGEHGDGSPDGRRLAYANGDGEGGGSLWVVPVDGPGETVTVCTRNEAVEAPV